MELWLDIRSTDPSCSRSRFVDCDRLLARADQNNYISDAKIETFWVEVDLLKQDLTTNLPSGKVVDVSTPEGQNDGLAAIGSVEWILAETSGEWRMIPAENLIVAARSGGTKLAFCVEREEDISGLSTALELGVDALCLRPDATDAFWEAAKTARAERSRQEPADSGKISQPTTITGKCRRATTKAVLADRVCVDFVMMLSSDEGCWIGSSAKMTALILSEAAPSSLVPSRPFRVNAGPVHSYILMADGTFKYLCELEAGDEVCVYHSTTGKTRPVTVGRIKVERRPCLMAELFGIDDSGSKGHVFLQQAETVRLAVPNEGMFVRATDLTYEGAEVLLRTSANGTHIGKAYAGKVVEK